MTYKKKKSNKKKIGIIAFLATAFLGLGVGALNNMETQSASFHSGGNRPLYGAGAAFYSVKMQIMPGSSLWGICIFPSGRLYCPCN